MKHFIKTIEGKYPILIWLFLTLSISVLAQTTGSGTSFKFKEIRLKKTEILNLFELKPNEKSNLNLKMDGTLMPPVEISIINHVNRGEKSGAVAARLVLEKTEVRLLLNRKDRIGGLKYWMAILPPQGEMGYKLKEETGDEFVLVQVSKNEVVTE